MSQPRKERWEAESREWVLPTHRGSLQTSKISLFFFQAKIHCMCVYHNTTNSLYVCIPQASVMKLATCSRSRSNIICRELDVFNPACRLVFVRVKVESIYVCVAQRTEIFWSQRMKSIAGSLCKSIGRNRINKVHQLTWQKSDVC